MLALLAEKYGMEEEDFLSSELEVVPAGRARELGFDRSMVLGYGHDDRVCASPAWSRSLRRATLRKRASAFWSTRKKSAAWALRA